MRVPPFVAPLVLALLLASPLGFGQAPGTSGTAAGSGSSPGAEPGAASTLDLPKPTVVHALAVAQTSTGFVGSISNISITVANNGTGHVFVDTSPLAQVDMQGSARLAVRVASGVTGIRSSDKDAFFVVRSDAPVIGGPSAGGIMTVGTIAAMEGWSINQSVAMTGTINPDGDIGPIGGLLEKISAAAQSGITLFLFPEGQENVSALENSAKGSTVSTLDHCASVGIRCIAVGQVEDAVRYVTGHAFAPRPTVGNVTSEGFVKTMRPLAANLTAHARNLTVTASSHYDRVARSLAPNLARDLQSQLSDATHALLQADTAFSEGRYYTASSRSYQASVEARYVDSALSLVDASDKDAYTRGELKAASEKAAAALASAKLTVAGVSHLGGVGAAQERATEAEQAAQQAAVAYQQGTVLSTTDSAGQQHAGALQLTAQAKERSESVAWWLTIAQQVRDANEVPLDEAQLNRTARDFIDTAREEVVYADLLLQESTGQQGALSGAGGPQDLLANAEKDIRRGYAPAAIFEAIRAEVRASAAVDLLGSGQQVQESKVQRAKERAGEAIVQARQDGFEPILAQSYYEFAGDLSTPQDALTYYDTARNTALLGHAFFAPQAGERTSRFVGFEPIPASTAGGSFAGLAFTTTLLLFAFVLGGVLGGALALLVALLLRKPAANPASASYPPPPPPRPPESPPLQMDPFLSQGEGESPAQPPSTSPPPASGDAAPPPERPPYAPKDPWP